MVTSTIPFYRRQLKYASCVTDYPVAVFHYLSKVHHMIDALKKRQLEPSDFCRKWIKSIAPDERGYYKACVKAIAEATGLSERTIEGWGPDFKGRPDSVLVTLSKEDTINQIRVLVKVDNLPDYLKS
ncbi:hypothetical protein Cri9333_0557 [Crinalium epipsammum PCC 9333]|uniref:Uncharacterized protein n=1 Tax=Crinalium epipsammum PCC 9333 TaxID=1173022 RepID=K9VVI0_9CYAN|nr:hypothetical protein [Crinalium epipsammum]AFZ11507.1 hypothetical protein Cri9333_0557 [Crinalium epipsammum PCC 9333]